MATTGGSSSSWRSDTLPLAASHEIAAGSIPNFDSIRRECGTAPGQTRHERRVNSGGPKRDLKADAEDLLRQGSRPDSGRKAQGPDARISPTLGGDAAPVGVNVLDFCATPRDTSSTQKGLRQEEGGMGHLLSPRQGWSAGNARSTARRPGSGALRPGSAGTRRGPDSREDRLLHGSGGTSLKEGGGGEHPWHEGDVPPWREGDPRPPSRQRNLPMHLNADSRGGGAGSGGSDNPLERSLERPVSGRNVGSSHQPDVMDDDRARDRAHYASTPRPLSRHKSPPEAVCLDLPEEPLRGDIDPQPLPPSHGFNDAEAEAEGGGAEAGQQQDNPNPNPNPNPDPNPDPNPNPNPNPDPNQVATHQDAGCTHEGHPTIVEAGVCLGGKDARSDKPWSPGSGRASRLWLEALSRLRTMALRAPAQSPGPLASPGASPRRRPKSPIPPPSTI